MGFGLFLYGIPFKFILFRFSLLTLKPQGFRYKATWLSELHILTTTAVLQTTRTFKMSQLITFQSIFVHGWKLSLIVLQVQMYLLFPVEGDNIP